MKIRYFTFLLTILLGWTGLSQIVKAQEEATEVGIESEGQTVLNLITIPYYQYTGECPGEAYGSIKGWFTSSETVPTTNRRVIIRNISRGMSPEEPPYTDREYFKGRASEGIAMRFGNQHDDRFFRVLPGLNTFEYEVRNGDTVIKRGLFKSQVFKSTPIVEQRDRVRETESVPIEYQEWNGNKYVTKTRYETKVVYKCPQ